jgi:hypothetical protein
MVVLFTVVLCHCLLGVSIIECALTLQAKSIEFDLLARVILTLLSVQYTSSFHHVVRVAKG